MQSTINKYGEIEVIGNEVHYSIPLSYTDFDSLDELEMVYKQKGTSLAVYSHYLFAHDITLVTNRLVFTYYLENMKSFYYLRQLYFEDQVYYFRSFIELAKNNHNTAILWDKNNLFVDLTDSKVKALVFEFSGHSLYNIPPTLDGLKEVILLSLTTLFRVLGKPRLTDFIDQRDMVIRFAEQVLRADSVQEIERVLEETIVNIERQEEIRLEYEESLQQMKFFERRREIKKAKAAGKLTAATISDFVEKPNRGLRSGKNSNPKKQANHEEKQGFFNSKYFFLGSAGVAAVLLTVNILSPTDPNVNASALNNSQVEKEEKSVLSSDEVADVYRRVINGENEAAITILETAGFEHLADTERKQLVQLYEKEGQYHKILQLDPSQADIDMVVKKMIEKKEIKQLKELQSRFPAYAPINYEVAYMTAKYDTVISLASDIDLTDSELAERRKSQLLVSYLWSGLLKEARELAGDDSKMIKKVSQFESSSQKIKDLNNSLDTAQDKGDEKEVKELKQKINQIKTNINRI